MALLGPVHLVCTGLLSFWACALVGRALAGVGLDAGAVWRLSGGAQASVPDVFLSGAAGGLDPSREKLVAVLGCSRS